MGCVSSLHKPSAMKVHLSSCSNRKPDNQLAIPPSPIKERPPIIEGNVAVKPQWPPLHSTANFRDFGSKEEKFFDSQAWLESDCDDDFMSVNGEFTPSRGNTPVHHNFRTGSHEPSMSPIHPSKKKKRLSELFQEGLRETLDVDEKNGKSGGEKVVAGGGGGGLKTKRERWVESVQMHGCLPSLVSSCRLVNTQEAAHVARK